MEVKKSQEEGLLQDVLEENLINRSVHEALRMKLQPAQTELKAIKKASLPKLGCPHAAMDARRSDMLPSVLKSRICTH